MANPSYIDTETGALTDGAGWVALQTADIGSADVVQWLSTKDGQVGDWSQYLDLVIVSYTRADYASTSASATIHINNDTTSNYEQQLMYGGGTSATASGASTTYIYLSWTSGNASPAKQFGASVTHLTDINSGKYKTVTSLFADEREGAGYVAHFSHIWKSQDPIEELDVAGWGGVDFMAGSYLSLFGVLPRMVTA